MIVLPRLLKAQEVSEQTSIPLSRIYELAREGSLPCVRMGRAMRFSAPAVLEWIENGGTGPESDR